MPERKRFFSIDVFPKSHSLQSWIMAMFQYCDHMYFYAYSAIICVCTSRCRSVAGFDLHRISISSSTCVCLSELHHITSSCSSSASSALLTEAAPGDASCICQISQMSSDATTLPDQTYQLRVRYNHIARWAQMLQLFHPNTIISSISVAKSCFQKKIQFCWIFLHWNEKKYIFLKRGRGRDFLLLWYKQTK